ncbi:MAG: hypothetical protein IPM17_11355 [Verrucomicrobia bacterium]|nr:hypothetical protein [Verrucomicrobiota bacterium]
MDRATAWSCAVANLAALPGLGSIAAGRRIGYAQAALALAGFGLSLLWLLLFIRDWRVEGELPLGWRPALGVGLAGIGLFGTAWLWALRTSRSLLRESGQNGTPSPAAPPPPSLVNPAHAEPPDEQHPATPPRL